ncbi:hypothetical protein CRG98_049121, partial [Punica granatum]
RSGLGLSHRIGFEPAVGRDLAAADGSAWVSHSWLWVPLGLEKNRKKLEARLIDRPISE